MTIKEIPVPHRPEVVKELFLAIQVCVPVDWLQKQIEEFANDQVICGTKSGWMMRTEPIGDDLVKMECNEKEGFVHIIMDC